MTPPPAATHAAHSGALTLRPVPTKLVTSSLARVLGARAWGRIRFLVDVVVLYLASSAALFADSSVRVLSGNHIIAALFPLLVIAILYARRGPDERMHGSLLDTATHVLGVVSLAAMLAVAADSMLGLAHPLGLPLRLWIFTAVYLGASRTVLLSVRRQAIRAEAFAMPTLIVGAGMVGEHLVKRLTSEPRYGLRPVGFLDSNPLPRHDRAGAPSVPVLGGPGDLAAAVEQTGASQVILAFSSEPDHVLVETVKECQKLGVEVALVPRLYESINERATLDHVGGLPLVSLRPTNPRGWQFAVKHAIDRTFAALMLLALSPLMIAIAIAVRLSSPGEIFFRQKRVGRDGHEFSMLKFRTMRGDPATDGEADAGWASQVGIGNGKSAGTQDSRVTPVGRLLRQASLDELPQLINVLRGDMSIVGPRPERVSYVRDFGRVVDGYNDRHRVKSGVTGWAQVSGFRGQTSIVDRVEWDNWYIQNWSLRLDLRIIAMTISEVLRFRG